MNKKNAGFTIVELIVAISVFAILVPAVAAFLNLLGTINDRARDIAVINALVENKVETLRSLSFVGVNTGTTDFTDDLPDAIAPPRSATYEVSAVSSTLKEINISVSYNDHGETRTLTYKTYLGELGVAQY